MFTDVDLLCHKQEVRQICTRPTRIIRPAACVRLCARVCGVCAHGEHDDRRQDPRENLHPQHARTHTPLNVNTLASRHSGPKSTKRSYKHKGGAVRARFCNSLVWSRRDYKFVHARSSRALVWVVEAGLLQDGLLARPSEHLAPSTAHQTAGHSAVPPDGGGA